jgi:hypothetical protein
MNARIESNWLWIARPWACAASIRDFNPRVTVLP